MPGSQDENPRPRGAAPLAGGGNGVQPLAPGDIAPPFGAYSHGVLMPPGLRMIRTSGQLALEPGGAVPEGAEAQAALCLHNINRILAEGGMVPSDIVHLSAWVTDRAHMAGYMRARDAFLAGVPVRPASTLLIVSGFTRPEFLVEIEAVAMAP